MIREGIYRCTRYQIEFKDGSVREISLSGTLYFDSATVSVHLIYEDGKFLIYSGRPTVEIIASSLIIDVIFSSKKEFLRTSEKRRIVHFTQNSLILEKDHSDSIHRVTWVFFYGGLE